MRLIPLPPKRVLNKAFLKQRPLRSDMDLFKKELIALLDCIDANETEEFHKNLVSDFLKKAIYHNDNFINTKGRQDLVIHNGKDNKSNVGVIIEAKRPQNKSEWFSAENPNGKALQELVLYYLRERIEGNNIDIKYLIAANINEWYIIEAKYFENIFYHNKGLVKDYEEWRDGKKVTRDTGLFYSEIVKPFIEKLTDEIPCTYFNIQNYVKALKNEDKEDDKNLIALLKILSPQNLLKIPFANDSNELDDKFYKELLHIIGLEEAKEGSKNIIRRKLENKNSASLLEMAIKKLRTKGIHKITDLKAFGETSDEQYFNIALELCITWINRILFLKLLEGQLLSYHKSPSPFGEGRKGEAYRFLNSKMIFDFDELFNLFHNVLAVDINNRQDELQQKYKLVPYLNSSLFEISELEDVTICVDSLDNSDILEYIGSTILKEHKKKNEPLATLNYLFQFLDSYDFASEGSEDIQEDNKPLINASVLGKVFEKINGYKDGSIYTPGFITMYMCRQSIRMAVMQKFNDAKGWNIQKFDELYNQIDNIDEANNIINDLKLCDPAVGSGHFLVSALNEIITIKSELKILKDKTGRRLKEYTVEVENDELYVTDEDGEIFNYIPENKERQRIQETLFLEKQKIIENCLFGVDINPNSVKICRLRLWIELLKNAFYKEESGYKELETLPNIDINIKCGNSLISRFVLDADLSKALKSIKYNIETYRGFVSSYKNEKNRDVKRGLQKIIDSIKSDFRTEIFRNDTKYVKLQKLQYEYNMLVAPNIFKDNDSVMEDEVIYGSEENIRKAKDRKIKLEADIEKITKEIDEIKNNAIYKNALEWRFEFPEVLNNEGDFQGFDVVIGNPPYGVKSNRAEKNYYSSRYKSNDDIYTNFIEIGREISNVKGQINYIIPITWLTGVNYIKTRQLLVENFSLSKAINLPYNIFSNAYIDTGIYFFEKKALAESLVFEFNPKDKIQLEELINMKFKKLPRSLWTSKKDMKINLNEADNSIFFKLDTVVSKLENFSNSARGILADKNQYQLTEGINQKKVFTGNLNRYSIDKSFNFIEYGENLKEKPKSYNFFIGERILVRRIISRQFRIMATITKDEFVCKKDIYIIKLHDERLNAHFVLALLNSNLISYYKTKNSGSAKKDDFTQITLGDIRQLPIPIIPSSAQQPFITLVNQILESKQQGNDTTDLEKKVDNLVFDLYGITTEEIKIIEGK